MGKAAAAVSKACGDLIYGETLRKVVVEKVQDLAEQVRLIGRPHGVQRNPAGQVAQQRIADALLQDLVFGVVCQRAHEEFQRMPLVVRDKVRAEAVGGEQLLDGWDDAQWNNGDDGEAVVRGIGVDGIAVVHQQNSIPSDITVEEVVSYGRIPHKKYFQGNSKEDEEIINWAIEKTGLKNLKSKAVMSLSGGERQRVFIAMALAQKSEILFLDEPTTYLDIYHQVEVLELVKKLNKEENLTVLMVLHDINQALKYSDNIIIMKKGKIIESGKSEKVINMNLLKEVYNIGGYITDYNKEKVFIPLKL